jgi:hypothetical protein
MVAMELRLSAAVVDAATAAATAAVTAAMAQVQQQHGVLEISRSRPSAQSERLKAIGTVVDDRTLQGVQDEGGMLAISVFLQEAGVKPELLRRLLPGFAEEAGRRKLERWHGRCGAALDRLEPVCLAHLVHGSGPASALRGLGRPSDPAAAEARCVAALEGGGCDAGFALCKAAHRRCRRRASGASSAEANA